ncbi:MAG: chorismate synthase [Anaerovoracaceae bacterium]
MLSNFGNHMKISIFGGSHEDHIGVTISGLPSNTAFDLNELQSFLTRRAPGNSPFTTSRKESDLIIPKDGVEIKDNIGLIRNGFATFIINNTNTHKQDYDNLKEVPRPGHADYTAYIKYGRQINMSGGGPFSARMTAPLCIAGGIAIQMLRNQGIKIGAHIYKIGNVIDTPFDPANPSFDFLPEFPVFSQKAKDEMKSLILAAKEDSDSVGGVVEACVTGCPPGMGGPMYQGVESILSPILFGIPAVKGLEFGAGFSATDLRGSENNDDFYMAEDQVKTRTNNHGGILGGITSGMPIITRLAFKPTPSIGKKQNSVNLKRKENQELSIKGRHDPCVVLRAVPVVEAALAIGILDIIMEEKK